MVTTLCVVFALPCSAIGPTSVGPASDTIRIEVGSKEVNGRVYLPHAARVRVRVGGPDSPITSEWTNELTLGDSAGRPVMRWVTKSHATREVYSRTARIATTPARHTDEATGRAARTTKYIRKMGDLRASTPESVTA